MAGPVEQIGVIVPCPRCGNEVMQKGMIPLGAIDGVVSYACVPCARTLVRTASAEAEPTS